MIILKDLLYKVSLEAVFGELQQQIKSVTFDSRTVESQSLFVALKGEGLDGHDYIESAIEGGAISVLCEVLPSTLDDRCTYLQVQDSHKALGILASNFYGNPSYDLKVIGRFHCSPWDSMFPQAPNYLWRWY